MRTSAPVVASRWRNTKSSTRIVPACSSSSICSAMRPSKRAPSRKPTARIWTGPMVSGIAFSPRLAGLDSPAATAPGVTAAATTAVFATGAGPGVTALATTAVFATGAPMTPTQPESTPRCSPAPWRRPGARHRPRRGSRRDRVHPGPYPSSVPLVDGGRAALCERLTYTLLFPRAQGCVQHLAAVGLESRHQFVARLGGAEDDQSRGPGDKPSAEILAGSCR